MAKKWRVKINIVMTAYVTVVAENDMAACDMVEDMNVTDLYGAVPSSPCGDVKIIDEEIEFLDADAVD